jgi:hypothetical protein
MAELLDRWVAADIISGDQADRIRADASTPAEPARVSRTGSLVAEAMGYLGGVIVLVGLGLVVGRFWSQLSIPARIGLAAGVASALLIAGAVVTNRLGAAGGRLRSVLWFASSLAYFAALALLSSDQFGWYADRLLVFAAGGAGLVSVALWLAHRRLPQQAAVLACLLIAAGAATSMITHSGVLPGVAIWAVGALWWGAGSFGLFPPAQGAVVLGAVAAIVGSVWIENEPWGTGIALLTVLGLIAAAVLLRDLVLLAAASLGTLVVLPQLVVRYFPGLLSAALTLVVVGLILVVVAVVTARRRRQA